MPVKPGSLLWNRLFGEARKIAEDESEKAVENIAGAMDLASRPAFQVCVIEFLERAIRESRVIPGAHEDMLYRAGFRDGLESVLDRMRALQHTAKERYDGE